MMDNKLYILNLLIMLYVRINIKFSKLFNKFIYIYMHIYNIFYIKYIISVKYFGNLKINFIISKIKTICIGDIQLNSNNN